MNLTGSYRVFLRPELADSENLATVLETSRKVSELLSDEKVKSNIASVHKFGASSHKVQTSILKEIEELGFSSERKGLFADFNSFDEFIVHLFLESKCWKFTQFNCAKFLLNMIEIG